MPHEPKKRHSRARQGKRRANIKLDVPGFNACLNCKDTTLPHTVCKKCGFYDGKQIVKMKTKNEKSSSHSQHSTRPDQGQISEPKIEKERNI
jgi:large subunit ribosomal protein L32